MSLPSSQRCTSSACGPLWSFVGNCDRIQHLRGKGTPGQVAALRWSGLRFAPAALRCSVSWPRRRTRFAHCVRCARTTATSQSTTRAAREATSPALLGAPQARPGLPGRAFAGTLVWFATSNTSAAARQAVPGGGDLCGGEECRTSVGARSALRKLTRRSCPSVVSEANAASFATRLKADAASPDTEQSLRTVLCLASALALASARARSAVGAKRRPPQHEPPAGTACRAARRPSHCRRPRMTATGRKQKAHNAGREGCSLQALSGAAPPAG